MARKEKYLHSMKSLVEVDCVLASHNVLCGRAASSTTFRHGPRKQHTEERSARDEVEINCLLSVISNTLSSIRIKFV